MNVHNNDKPNRLVQIDDARETLSRIIRGAGAILHDFRKVLLLVAALAVCASLWIFRYPLLGYGPESLLSHFFDLLVGFTVLLFALAAPFIFCWVFGAPWQAGEVQDNLQRIGFVNKANGHPYLLAETTHPENPNISIYEFKSCGLTPHKWLESIDTIQSALNRTVVDIRPGKDEQHVLVSVGPPAFKWPERLVWRDTMVDDRNFVLALGHSPLGPVTVDLTSTPHILIGGSTGSGKSILLKCLLRQSVGKGAKVFISDFKGGLDYSKWWRECCHMAYDLDSTQATLNEFLAELNRRQKLLYDAGCSDMDSYNKTLATNSLAKLHRWIFASDETAAMLDKTGQSKERKAQQDEISYALCEIARKGRAVGLHLFLSLQRPDATILPGQLKSNMDVRVAGRCDSILSDIILDCSAAADRIPKDARGRFVLNNGSGENTGITVFQGYIPVDDLQLK